MWRDGPYQSEWVLPFNMLISLDCCRQTLQVTPGEGWGETCKGLCYCCELLGELVYDSRYSLTEPLVAGCLVAELVR